MTTRPIVVFDLDDVLASFNTELSKHLAEMLDDPSVATHHLTWDRYDIDHLYPQIKNFQDVFMSMEREGKIATLPPIKTMVDVARQYRDVHDFEIVVLTARGWMKDAREVTAEWLAKNDVPVDRLIVSPYRVSKKMMMPMGVVTYYDDHADHIRDCAPLVDSAILIDRPWNQHLECGGNIYRLEIDAPEGPMFHFHMTDNQIEAVLRRRFETSATTE